MQNHKTKNWNWSSSGVILIGKTNREKEILKTYTDRIGCTYKNGELFIQLPFKENRKTK